MKTKVMSVLCGILVSSSLLGQTLTAYRSGTPTNYTVAELSVGTLSDVDSLATSGTWNNDQLLTLQQSLKTSWSSGNSISNKNLKKVDMSNASFSGTMTTGSQYLFRNCTALQQTIFPAANITDAVSLANTFTGCSTLKEVRNTASFQNITNLYRTFYDCSNLEWVKFTINPFDAINLSETFGNANPNCIKYIPDGIGDRDGGGVLNGLGLPGNWSNCVVGTYATGGICITDGRPFNFPVAINIRIGRDVKLHRVMDDGLDYEVVMLPFETQLPSRIRAFEYTGIIGDSLTFNEVSTLQAYKPYLIKATGDIYIGSYNTGLVLAVPPTSQEVVVAGAPTFVATCQENVVDGATPLLNTLNPSGNQFIKTGNCITLPFHGYFKESGLNNLKLKFNEFPPTTFQLAYSANNDAWGSVGFTAENLLSNNGFENDFTGWTNNQGASTIKIDVNPNYAFAGSKFAVTSHTVGWAYQIVDLVAKGYTEEELDVQPTFMGGIYIAHGWGARFKVDMVLLDANNNVLFTQNIVNKTNNFDDWNWSYYSAVCKNYGTGVRKVKFYLEGKDTRGWAGFYGGTYDEAFLGLAPNIEEDGNYPAGSEISLTATPKPGYMFVNWNDGNTDNPRRIVMDQAQTLVANFGVATYDIAVSTNPVGLESSLTGSGNYTHNNTVTLTATNSANRTFSKWTDESYTVSTDASFGFTAKKARHLVAHFTTTNMNTGDTTAVACDSFTWYGVTYNQTPTTAPTHLFVNKLGGDSVVTLHLTIYPTTADTTVVAVDSYTWYGSTYNASGDYTHVVNNAYGCNKTITLHLTIVSSVARIEDYYFQTLQGAIDTATSGATIVLLKNTTEDISLSKEIELQLDANRTITGNFAIGKTGKLTLPNAKTLAISGDFILRTSTESEAILTGQAGASITAGAIYLDRYININLVQTKYYGFTAPFDVALDGGILNAATNKKITQGYDMVIYEWFGQTRATTGYVGNADCPENAWQRVTSDLVAGKAYMMAVKNNVLKIRAKAKTPTIVLSNDNSQNLYGYSSALDSKHAGWNFLAQPLMRNGTFGANGYVQVLKGANIYETKAFTTTTRFAPFTTFFYQAAGNGTLHFTANANSATLRSVEMPNTDPLEIRLEKVDTKEFDRAYLTLTEDASTAYEIGKDVLKMGIETSVPQLFFRELDYNLAVCHTKTQNNQAQIAMRLLFPTAGTYTIGLANKTNNIVYLTENGLDIWNLSEGNYTFNKSGYEYNQTFGLRVGTNYTVTNINTVESDLRIYTDVNAIVIEGIPAGDCYRIYDAVGKLLVIGTSTGSTIRESISVHGLYLVKTATQSIKVIK